MACERIVDVCEKIIDGQYPRSKQTSLDRLTGYCMATVRRIKRKFKARLPSAGNKPEFHRHRYPDVSLEDMRLRVARLQKVLGYSEELKVEQIHHEFFRVCQGGGLDT